MQIGIQKAYSDESSVTNNQTQQSFSDYYKKPDVPPLQVRSPQYELPLKLGQLYNSENFTKKLPLDNSSINLLEKNGFVVMDKSQLAYDKEDIASVYGALKTNDLPIFITTDSLLHFYHIQFDQTLKEIEESQFYDKIWNISKKLYDKSLGIYESTQTGNKLNEAAKLNTAYFSVALMLLQPTKSQVCPSDLQSEFNNHDFCQDKRYFTQADLEKYSFTPAPLIRDDMLKELELITNHGGFAASPIFGTKDDYSQYLPRGHYDSSEKLRNYFKALTWYGRNTFLLKDDVQTIAASIIASGLENDEMLKSDWNTIYSVTAFFVGFLDDLGPIQYESALKNISHTAASTPSSFSDPIELTKNYNIAKLKAQLASLPLPKIYGGLSECVIIPPFTEKKMKECIESGVGMRFMGQRFIPDSYAFTNLTGPAYTYNASDSEKELPFTAVQTKIPGIIIRGFPRGLDVMVSILDSEYALKLLSQMGDINYTNYTENLTALRAQFDSLDEKEWHKNLYWSWLYSLKPVLKVFSSGYPTFMQTDAWLSKDLNTALASWAQLRHDTILYSKQSYTPTMATAAPPGPEPPPPPPPPPGYVEPIPEFYARLLALTNMTYTGLSKMHLLNSYESFRLQELVGGLKSLQTISEKELQSIDLSQDDLDFINHFDDWSESIISGSDITEDAKKTTIIADVHTDQNTLQALEEGTGFVKLMVVAFKDPEGRVMLSAGPLLSYYEFKQPVTERLTDKNWRLLLSSTDSPNRPTWAHTFSSD